MTKVTINKDTTVCISLASKPSNFGTRFHNYLYNELGLNFVYKAFTTGDLSDAISGIRGLGIRGCGVSMPYKEACIPFLDEISESAAAIDSVNTIVNTDGHLKAYNTDYIAIYELIKQNKINTETTIAVNGSGGMAKAVACALRDLGFKKGYIIARNQESGEKLSNVSGFEWIPSLDEREANLLINATPIGMKGSGFENESPFTDQQIAIADTVFDVVAFPSQTPLIQYATQQDKQVILGSDVFAIQALEQFALYTGKRPTEKQFQEAAKYSQA